MNDFELRPEIKNSPPIHIKPTEAIFAVVRSELADFLRHSAFHLNFINPSLNTLAQTKETRRPPGQHSHIPEGGEMRTFEEIIEHKYLASCDPENPLRFMTIWTTRGYLARYRLLEHYSRHSTLSVPQTDAQRKKALSHALSMLECDPKLKTSPLTKGYLWLVDFHVPAIAFIHILSSLSERPAEDRAEMAWAAMSDNYEARAMDLKPVEQSVFMAFSRAVLQAWGAHEALLRQQDKPPEPPRLVSDIRNKVSPMSSTFPRDNSIGEQLGGPVGVDIDEYPRPMPMDLGGHGHDHGLGEQSFPATGPGGYPDISWQATMERRHGPVMDHHRLEIDRCAWLVKTVVLTPKIYENARCSSYMSQT